MKKIILSAAVIMLVVTGFSTTPPDVNPDVNIKVLDAFNKTFGNIKNLEWFENESSYEAHFNSDGVIRVIVWYDKDGDLLRMHRYYNEDKLPPFLLTGIRKKMPTEKIYGVTEITGREGVEYYITIESEKHWIKIKADARGQFEVYEKFKKA